MGCRRFLKEYGVSRTARWCAFSQETASRFRACTLLATVSIAACQTSATGPDFLDRLVDGITYRVTEFVIAESFPVQLRITVELENESATPKSVTFPDGCVVLIRAYDVGREPAWDMGSTVACTLALIEVNLAAGESQTFDTGLVSAATILGDSLPDGEYRITVYLRPGQIVELEAGLVDLAAL
jgi:hypothetical protein